MATRTQPEQKVEHASNLRTTRKIKLNVGGTYYTTTLTTLQSEPNSMLAAMFAGLVDNNRFPIEKDQDDGAYFIDRNGRVFEHILEWLRTKKISPQLSKEDLFWLQEEAKYYQLSELEHALESYNTHLEAMQQLSKSKKTIAVPTLEQWRTKRTFAPSILLPTPVGSSSSPFSFAANNSKNEELWFDEEILPYLEQGYKPVTIANRIVLVLEE